MVRCTPDIGCRFSQAPERASRRLELVQLRLDPDGCTVSYESIDDGSVDVRFTPKEGRTVRVVRARVRAEFDADHDVFEGWTGARRWELAYIADVEIGLATIA